MIPVIRPINISLHQLLFSVHRLLSSSAYSFLSSSQINTQSSQDGNFPSPCIITAPSHYPHFSWHCQRDITSVFLQSCNLSAQVLTFVIVYLSTISFQPITGSLYFSTWFPLFRDLQFQPHPIWIHLAEWHLRKHSFLQYVIITLSKVCPYVFSTSGETCPSNFHPFTSLTLYFASNSSLQKIVQVIAPDTSVIIPQPVYFLSVVVSSSGSARERLATTVRKVRYVQHQVTSCCRKRRNVCTLLSQFSIPLMLPLPMPGNIAHPI